MRLVLLLDASAAWLQFAAGIALCRSGLVPSSRRPSEGDARLRAFP